VPKASTVENGATFIPTVSTTSMSPSYQPTGCLVVERYGLIDGEAAAEDQRMHGAIFRPIPAYGRGIIDPDTTKKGLQVEFTVEDPNVFTMP
jgi:hypothetical protein